MVDIVGIFGNMQAEQGEEIIDAGADAAAPGIARRFAKCR
jgi:hypothetical protein